jgi:polyisoprenoid-binding protein YceI
MLSRFFHIAGIAVLILVLFTGNAASSTYRVDPAYSSFDVQNDIHPVKGSFENFEGTIVYEPTQVEKSSVDFCLKANSFKVQSDDVIMGGGLFFDLNKHPEIRFHSTSIVNNGDYLLVTGNLSMLGETRQVTLPVEILGRGTHPKEGLPIAGFAAKLKVKISDLGVNTWTNATGILGNTLNIQLKLVGVNKEAQVNIPKQIPSKL